MNEFSPHLYLEENADPDYTLGIMIPVSNDWGEFDAEPIVSVENGITYVTIRLIENGNGVQDFQISLTKPENAVNIEVTVKGVDEEGNDLGEPQPRKNERKWD